MKEKTLNTGLGEEWLEYYEMFPYFSHKKIREGCYPWKMINNDSKHAIVLIHGLTDSPYYMQELAEYFFTRRSYSVFMPLLQCHGLKDPDGMRGVSLEEWKKNVRLSVDHASRYGAVSIGGLSTGGTLGLFAIETMENVDGCLYLFSGALAFSGGIIGRFKQWIIRTWVADLLKYLERNKSLTGAHPYRYAHVDMGGARELSRLIKEVTAILNGYNENNPFRHWVFAVHHENDPVVSFTAVKKLQRKAISGKFKLWRIPVDIDISHAGVVLKKDITFQDDKETVIEKANPLFHQLLEQIDLMERRMVNA